MQLDQGAEAPRESLPAGWAFGKGSIKPHWFDAGHIISACGKATYSGIARNAQRKPTDPCSKCEKELSHRVTYD